MKTIAVVMESGLVTAVVSSEPIEDVQVLVVDYDIGCINETADLDYVPLIKGTRNADAFVSLHQIEKAGIDIDNLLANLGIRRTWHGKP